MRSNRNWLLSAATFVALAAAMIALPVPSDPDRPFHEAIRLGAFFYFAFWMLGVVGWGRLCSVLLEDSKADLLEWLAYGTGGVSVIGFGLAASGLVGFDYHPLFVGLTLLGPLLDAWLRRRQRSTGVSAGAAKKWLFGNEVEQRGKWIAALLLLAIIGEIASRLNGASIAHYHSDPMFYHVYGPRLWSEAGRMFFPWLHPVALQTSYWEYLSLWGNGLLGGPQGGGLVEGLLFMQWVHVALGFAGAALALNRVLLPIAPSTAWRRVSIVAGLTSGILGWTAWLAKNDWGLAFWCLVGVVFALRAAEERGRRGTNMALCGLFFGFALADKVVLLLALLPLFAALGWALRKRGIGARDAVTALLTATLVLAPNLCFSWYSTGNPFFPALNALFRSPWLSETVSTVMSASQTSENFGLSHLSWERLKVLGVQDPFFLLAVVGAPFALRLGALRFVPLAATLLTFIVLGRPVGQDDGTLHLRYLGCLLILGPGLGIAFLKDLLERWSRKKRTALEAAVVLALLAAAVTRFQFPFVSESLDPVMAMRLSAPGGDAKAWLRMNARADELIVTTGDEQLYPIASLTVASMRQVAYLDWLGNHETDPARLVSALKDCGATYVLDTLTPDGRLWSRAAVTIGKAVFANPEAVLYDGPRSRVIDLRRLYEALLQSCS